MSVVALPALPIAGVLGLGVRARDGSAVVPRVKAIAVDEVVKVVARAQLVAELKRAMTEIEQDGVVWVSWPKKSSGVQTDITEDVIREVALPMGLVDVKVCAVDETWSGLKLVIRKANRKS